MVLTYTFILLVFTAPPVAHAVRFPLRDLCIAARENVLRDLPEWPVVWVTGCELVGRVR